MRISDEEFEHEVETAIDSLPDRFKRALDNVGIAVADEPNERERATMQRQCDELLGLYEGVPITRRFTGYSGVMPDIITICRVFEAVCCWNHAVLGAFILEHHPLETQIDVLTHPNQPLETKIASGFVGCWRFSA